MAGKSIEIYKVLEKRLQQDVYSMKKFPTEMDLSAEFQISRNTVRKVLDLLIEKNLLRKTPNKSVEVVSPSTSLSFAFLTPAIYSEIFERLRYFVEHESLKYGTRLKIVDYTHWEDPTIGETLHAFDGVFMIPLSEDMPKNIQKLLSQASVPIIAFEQNLCPIGIPSIISTPEVFVQQLLDHLESLGHKNIHCVNTQNLDQVMLTRIQQWELWNVVHGGTGQLVQNPVARYGNPMESAHLLVKDFLSKNINTDTALLCLTEPCALGAARACWDLGIVPGKDISIATFDSGLSKYVYPSITSIEMPNLSPYVGLGIKWMKSKRKIWSGSLLLQPTLARIFEGESTVKI